MNLSNAFQKRTLFAINIDNWLVFKSLVEVVEKTNLPVIAQVSEKEAEFWGIENFYQMVDFQKKRGLPLFTNLDHGKKIAIIKKAINLGFDMVHIDGSDLNWQANIKISRSISRLAHPKKILVEAEPQKEKTFPEKIEEFSQKTKADLLAVFVGNQHGFNPQKEEKLDLYRLAIIKEKASKAMLTLHGGSGVSLKDLKFAINKRLIAKINVNSKLRFIYRQTWVKILKENKSLKFYELALPVTRALSKEIEKFLKLTF